MNTVCTQASFAFVVLILSFSPLFGQTNQPIDSQIQGLPVIEAKAIVIQLYDEIEGVNDFDSIINHYEMVIEMASSVEYYEIVAKSNLEIGMQHGRKRNSDRAISYFEKALEAVKLWGNAQFEGKILGHIGYTLAMAGRMKEALKINLETLKVAEAADDAEMIAQANFQLGDYYRLLHEPEQGVAYLENALDYYKEQGVIRQQCKVLYTLGNTYKVGKDKLTQRKGIPYFEMLLEKPFIGTLSTSQRAKVYTSLGSMYSYFDEHEKAEPLLLKGLELKRINKDTMSMMYSFNELCTYYLGIGKFEEAIRYGEEVKGVMEDKDDIFLKYDNFDNLSTAYAGIKNYKKAYEYLEISDQLRDSVNSQEKVIATAELEKKYQAAIDEEKIARKDLELAQHKTKTTTWILGLLAFGIALFFWMRSRLHFKAKETEQLEELNQTKSRLFTNISHELRTPLTLLVNPLRDLSMENQVGETVMLESNQLSRMLRNGERLERMIRQMMSLSKSEEGHLQLRAMEQNLSDFVRNIITSFESKAESDNIKLEFFTTDESLPVFFDTAKMEDILINLLSNAFKFTESGGKIKVILSKLNGVANLQVNDTGKGIRTDRIPFVFDRFYQVDDSDTRAHEGMGIGLAIVKEMVQLHHGSINVESETGEGSRFNLSFPLGSGHLKPNEIITQLEYKPRKVQVVGNTKLAIETQALNPLTQLPLVLVVDDNQDLLSYLNERLEKQFNVLVANRAHLGLELAFEQIPDLIISDVMMPEMNGFDFCKQLKTDDRTSHIPVILLTAKSDRDQIITGLTTGADDYITKPFDQRVLITKINNLIGQRRKLRLLFAEKITVQPSDLKVPSMDELFLSRVLEVAENRFQDPSFGVDQLSHEMGMSRSQLYRKLKALTDQTPTVFLRTIRLERAKQLLLQSAGNSTEIAYQVGFNNPNYFFKCFKDHFGRTPKELLTESEI